MKKQMPEKILGVEVAEFTAKQLAEQNKFFERWRKEQITADEWGVLYDAIEHFTGIPQRRPPLTMKVWRKWQEARRRERGRKTTQGR